MSNIGYSSPDWGMAGYYAQEDAAQKWEEYQEYLYDQELKNYESQKRRCCSSHVSSLTHTGNRQTAKNTAPKLGGNGLPKMRRGLMTT